tara:strand:+ start:6630 stop:6989 length:360 start_codon:yes stop_codon:yes gene_type:complete
VNISGIGSVKRLDIKENKNGESIEKRMEWGNKGLEVIKTRHKLIIGTGLLSTLVGIMMAIFVGYDWFVNHTGHEVLAIVSAFGILLGVQMLILSSLSSMLISLHQEQIHHMENQLKKSK